MRGDFAVESLPAFGAPYFSGRHRTVFVTYNWCNRISQEIANQSQSWIIRASSPVRCPCLSLCYIYSRKPWKTLEGRWTYLSTKWKAFRFVDSHFQHKVQIVWGWTWWACAKFSSCLLPVKTTDILGSRKQLPSNVRFCHLERNSAIPLLYARIYGTKWGK